MLRRFAIGAGLAAAVACLIAAAASAWFEPSPLRVSPAHSSRPVAGQVFAGFQISTDPPSPFTASCGHARINGKPISTLDLQVGTDEVTCRWRIPKDARGTLVVSGVRATGAGQHEGPGGWHWRIER